MFGLIVEILVYAAAEEIIKHIKEQRDNNKGREKMDFDNPSSKNKFNGLGVRKNLKRESNKAVK